MREIKFRAWDGGQFWYSNKFLHFDNGCHVCDIKNAPFEYDAIEQYTGLKDKNGVEIYEGDKITDGTQLMFVVWSEENGCFDLMEGFGFGDIVLFSEYQKDVLEVVGNVHESNEK